jgi:hypothetical protein
MSIVYKRFQKISLPKKLASNTLIFVVAFFFLFNLHNGHNWGDDFSMYIRHAQNLVQGIPYSQTGYIYNPDTSFYGPQAYPPIFPLMLAPLVYFFGVNLLILKIPGILCFIGFLFLLNNRIVRDDFPESLRVLLVGLVGFSPVFFYQSEQILSDIPFLLFTACALFLIDHSFTITEKYTNRWSMDALIGLLIYLSYGIRSIGFLLIPVVIILFFIRKRNNLRSLLGILLTAAVLMGFQNLLITGTGSYLDQFPASFTAILPLLMRMFLYYLGLIIDLFPIQNDLIQNGVFLIFFEFALLGLLVRFKKGVSSYELFFLIYTGCLLFWPSYQGYRFLLPVLPFYFLFMVEGIFYISQNLVRSLRAKKILSLVLIGCAILIYSNSYRDVFPRPLSDMQKSSTGDLFAYVKANTQKDDAIVFFKPRVLALYTGRRSMVIAVPGIGVDPLERMRQFNVDWVIARKSYDNEYQSGLRDLVKQKSDQFVLVYENAEFQVYRFLNK